MKTLLLSALVVLALGGCGIDKMIRDDGLQASREKCVEYGFRSGSDEFANCMQRSVESTERERDSNNRDVRRREDEREAREKK